MRVELKSLVLQNERIALWSKDFSIAGAVAEIAITSEGKVEVSDLLVGYFLDDVTMTVYIPETPDLATSLQV